MKPAFRILACVAIIVLLACFGYCWSNRSGHTAMDPHWGFAFFGPIFAIGLAARKFSHGGWFSANVVEASGFIGMALILLVTRFGVLNQYETWIDAGMPERHPHADWVLGALLVGGFGGSLLVSHLLRTLGEPSAEAGNGEGK